MNLAGDEQILELSDANIVLLFEITKLYWKFLMKEYYQTIET